MPSIDHRIVQMEFDNSKFNKNVESSVSALKTLNKNLDFSNVGDSFAKVQRAANSLDLSYIQAGVSALQDRFSTWGIVGMRVINELTASAINMGRRLANISIGQIITGGKGRASNIEKAKLMLEGLFKDTGDWQNKVKDAMGDANVAVSGTAYGLDEAAVVASQLAASGVEIKKWAYDVDNASAIAKDSGDDMSRSLMAISGLAAMTGSSYSDIGRIFTTVAGNGRLMGDQLLQLSGRGINVAATMAKQMGITESEIRDMVSQGKISFKEFSDAMFDAYSDQAYKANRTLTGVMANTKAALSKIGADFWTPLIQNTSDSGKGLVNIVQVMDRVREKLNDFRKAFSQPLGLNPDSEDTESWGTWVKVVNKSCTSIRNAIDSINATAIGENFGKAFNKSVEYIAKLKDFFSGIGKEFDALFSGKISKQIDSFDMTLSKAYKTIIYDFIPAVKKIIDPINTVGELLTGFTRNIVERNGGRNLKNLANIIGNLRIGFNKFAKEVSGGRSIGDTFKSIGNILGDAFSFLLEVISKLSNLIPPIMKILGKAFKLAGDAIKNVSLFFDKIFYSVSNNKDIKSFFDIITEGFKSLSDFKFSDILANGFDLLKTAFKLTADALSKAWDIVKPLLEPFKEGLKQVIDTITSPFKIGKGSTILDVIETVIKTFAAIKLGSFAVDIVNLFKDIGSAISNFGKDLGGISAENIKELAKGLALLAVSMLILASIDPNKVGQTLGLLTAALSGLTGVFLVLKKANGTKVLSKGKGGIAEGIKEFLGNMSDAVSSFGTSTTSQLTAIAFAVLAVALAMGALSIINPERVGQVLLLLTSALGELLACVFVMKKIDGEGKGIKAGSILILALALIPIAGALMMLSTINPERIAPALIAMGVALGLLTGVVYILSKFVESSGSAIAGAAAVALISLSLLPAVAALGLLSLMNFEAMCQGLLGFVAVLSALMVATLLLSLMGPSSVAALQGAISVALIATALIPAVIALKVISSLGDFEVMSQALLGFVVVLSALGIAVGMLSLMGPAAVASLAGAVAIAVLSTSLLIAMVALKQIANLISDGTLLEGIIGLAVVLAALGVAILAISAISGPALVAAGVMAALGAALVVFGAGLFAISIAVKTAVDAIVSGVNALVEGVISLIYGIGDIATAIAQLFADLMSAIATMIRSIIEGVCTILGIHSPSTVFHDIGTNIVLGLIEGIMALLGLLATTAGKIADKALDGLKNIAPKAAEAGKNFIQGFVNGIAGMIGSVIGAVGNIASAALGGLKKLLGIHSPSTKAYDAGGFFVAGFKNALIKGVGIISKASSKLGKSALDGLNDAISGNDYPLDDFDDQPVITPILDLSEIQNGSAELASMFNNSYSVGAAMQARSGFRSNADINASNIEEMNKALASVSGSPEANYEYAFNIPVQLDGRQIAKASAKYTKDELNHLNKISNRKGGTK